MGEVKCQTCGYEWTTSSELEMVTCPNCGYKTARGSGGRRKSEFIRVSKEVYRELMKRKESMEEMRDGPVSLSETIREILEISRIPGIGEEEAVEIEESMKILDEIWARKRE